jgi:pSer/pThr/pTyr-binding forkhead associated (FHA) protein
MAGWILTSAGDQPTVLRISAGEVKTVGRTARADFMVDAALVSRLHCKLLVSKDGELTVQDLGSTNGTLVNGERVERCPLKTGDTLTVGRLEFTVQAS